MSENIEAVPDVDRGIPSLEGKGRRRGSGLWIRVTIIVFVLSCVAIAAAKMLISKWAENHHQQTEAAQRANTDDSAKGFNIDETKFREAQQQGGMPLPPPAGQGPSAPGSPAAPTGQPAAGHASTGTTAASGNTGAASSANPGQDAAANQAREDRLQKIADADLSIYQGGPASSGATTASGGEVDPITNALSSLMKNQDGQDKPKQDTSSLKASLKNDPENASYATVTPNRSLTAAKGTRIPCVLETALQSDVSGQVSCHLTENLYSEDGRVLLAERYTKVTGQYESASLKSGQSRIFVLWTDMETPFGVHATFDSPAADAMGRAGVDGKINIHFWQRFGAGLLLSVVDDITASAANRNNSQSVQFTNTSSEGSKAAQIALEHSVDIPPTLSKDNGAVVMVYLARNVSFANVYDLRAAR